MTTRLVDSGWSRELTDALKADASELRIICPFIKVTVIDRLLSARSKSIQVITRFNLTDFAEGVSDIEALRRLLAAGATVRGIRNLHSKLYVFGRGRAIVTSANLTEAAMSRNHEFGLVADDPSVIASCHRYFDDMWGRGGENLRHEQLDAWEKAVTRHHAQGGRPNPRSSLGDYGSDAGMEPPPPVTLPTAVADAPQAFVKFLGEGNNRVPLSLPTIDEIKASSCHWAVAYPKSKRPNGVKEGAVIFVARLTKDPPDMRIFGRAIGMKHDRERDNASPAEIVLLPWKEKWPRYIRVHDAEFVAGSMFNGISLDELMRTFGADAFRSTQRNRENGKGNTDPRKAYRQQAAVELSTIAQSWLSEQLQLAFNEHGKISQDVLRALHWPTLTPIS